MSDHSIHRMNPAELLNLGMAADARVGSSPASQLALPTPEELSARIPSLEVVEQIGSGGMGGVFLGRQRHLDRMVAVKVLPQELARDPRFADRFTREARALAKLVHPRIVTIHDFGHDDDLSYLVMEYMDGMSLRELMDSGQLAPQTALALFGQICEAIQHAHDEGIVHRDLKPENILFDRRGHLKIADFGLAKLTHLSTVDATLTGSRQAMGTLHYMAPEQWETPQAVDHRSDIFALGVLLYEMLTGKLPMGSFERPSDLARVDATADDIVLKAMQREPENRYQRVDEMSAALAQIATETDEAVMPSDELDRGTFTKLVDIGSPALALARRIIPRPKVNPTPPPRPRWSFPWGTFVAAIAVFGLTIAPWLYIEERRSHYAGFTTAAKFNEIVFDNSLPFVAMLGILVMTFLQRQFPVRSQLLTIVFAGYGLAHIGIFYGADGYISYSRGEVYSSTAAPLAIAFIMGCILCDRLWSVSVLLDPEGMDALMPKGMRRSQPAPSPAPKNEGGSTDAPKK